MVKERTERAASFNPDTFAEGGGLLDNVDVTWKELNAEMWDYNGTIPDAVPAVKITMEVEDVEGDQEQYFSCGSAKDWEPSKDGKRLVSVGKASGINKTSNLGILLMSLIEAKFPKDKMDTDDLTVFEGLKCHMIRMKEPERKGLVRTPRADGKVYEKTNLVVDHIIRLPWEGGKGSKSIASKSTGKAGKGKTTADDDVEIKAIGLITTILESNPKGVDKKKLAQLILQEAKGDPDRNAILKLAYNDSFLEEGPWEYKNGKVGGVNSLPTGIVDMDDDIPF